ncbi:type I polyketide synthase [Streptomyces sp. NPDC001709]
MSTARTNSDAADALAARLRDEVAGLLAVPPDAVPADRPLPELGLESADLTALTQRMSGWLRRPVPTWTVWQYPTPTALAAHLTGDDRAARASTGVRAGAHAPIAIVGIGCRLPGGIETPEALWQGLLDGVTSRRGGFLDDVAGFDADLFRLSPAEARLLDPHQRIALETAWAALEDARIVPDQLAASRTGVFLGTTAPEPTRAAGADPRSAPGWNEAAAPALIAHALGLAGPALAVATTCASALTAAHLAVRALRDGEVDLALVGGVHAMRDPHTDDGCRVFDTDRCRAFEADASGDLRGEDSGAHVSGEGGGVLVLRRLTDALAAGDRVYAVIRGSAVRHDRAGDRPVAAGSGPCRTGSRPGARTDVLRAAWQDAGIRPRHVAYVESHGADAPLGDPVGAEALGTVFADGRAEALRIGSAAANFGHLQAAAGAVGLMKTALALYHGELPATPAPSVDGAAGRLAVVTERIPWPGGCRYAGVGDFGSDGTHAHLALEEAPHRRRLFVPLAADSVGELRAAADMVTDRADAHRTGVPYAPEVLGRATGAHRLVVAVDHPADLGGALGERIADRAQGTAGRPDALAFCFSGPGSQWLGMGRDLLGEPAFRAAFEECDRALRTFTGWSVTEELLADRASSRLGRSDVDQPVLFALQTALARTLSAWGVEPGVVFGQSVGEMAAAVFAGALPLEEGARLITTWSRLVTERAAGHGALTVCELSVEDAESLPGVRAGQLSLAGHLAPGQVCLSGPREAVGALERDLDGLGVRAVRVNIDHAAHSARLAALAPELQRRLGVLRTRAATVPFWSTATGGYADGTDLDAAYWARSMCTPMRLAEATCVLADRRGLRVVEITPHPVASHSLRRGLDAVGAGQPPILSTGRRGRGARQALEDVAAALWCDGSDVDWGAVTGRSRRRAAPGPVVLTVSGRTARARAENAARLAHRLDGTPDAGLPDVAYTAARHRSHLEHRASVVAASSAEAAEALRALAAGCAHPGLSTGKVAAGPDLAMLFAGEGGQRIGMGRELYAAFAEFRRALDEVCAALDPWLRLPLAAVLFAAEDGPDAALIHDTEFTQPALFAMEVALFRLWQSWGVVPAAVAGRSVGEIAAAHVAGVLDLADAARLVAARGRLTRAGERDGATASVRTYTSVTGEYEQVVAECVFGEPSIVWVSTVTGDVVSAGEVSDPAYWIRQVRAPARFAEALRTLESSGAGRYVECGPTDVPTEVKAHVSAGDEASGEVRSLLRTLGALHVAGRDIRWERVFTTGVPVDLPVHAFQRAHTVRESLRGLGSRPGLE